MRELALHLMDIAENSVTAGARTVEIAVEESVADDRLRLTVSDDGPGMDEETARRVLDPFVTSRTTRRVGLGLPLLKAAAEACNGSLTLASAPGQGTRVEAEFQRSHIDRMPLGDLPGTFLALVIGWPQVHWVFRYRWDDGEFVFDDEPIKEALGDVPLTEPAVLSFLREQLADGIAQVQQAVAERERQIQAA
ncbi:MAG: ATP-binding protein [Anaerolineae bacterium]